MDNTYATFEALNVRGIRKDKKRSDVMRWLKKRNTLFFMLSETHCHFKKDRKRWGKEWSNDASDSYWSLGTGNSKGTTILINPRIKNLIEKITLTDVNIDPNGRYVKLIVQIGFSTYRLLSVYAPTIGWQRVIFFNQLKEVLNDGYDCETISGGDYNCAFNDILDRINCTGTNNDLGRIDLHQLMGTYDLEDAWRRRYPDSRQYTWHGPRSKAGSTRSSINPALMRKASRIDYFLTSTSLNNQIHETKISYAPYTDHRIITLTIRTNEMKRGPGMWKMNTSHIIDTEYKEKLRTLWAGWQTKKDNFSNLGSWWDIGKIKIKQLSKEYAQHKSLKKNELFKNIQLEIEELQDDPLQLNRIDALKAEYETLFSQETEGMKIRSKVQAWEEGERSTKYFHNLEKRNAKEKTWDRILDKDDNLVTGTKNIQKRQVEFYKELFQSEHKGDNKPETDFFLNNLDRKLSDESKHNLEKDITIDEVKQAIRKMPNGKSPGTDGLPAEFYKLNWDIIGEDLFEILIQGLNDDQLTYSQYLACIILLYKKDIREDIRNWRPISLLNVDYKILSKVLAERLKSVLNEIINADQRGCVPGRFIGENIRLIDDLIYEIENQQEGPIILMLDQEKAFDRVEWQWLFSTLKRFNFGDKFIGWLKTIYKDSKSCVITNGVQSEYFKISRGIRQGDSLSALLFIIQFEPLAEKLRKTETLEGINIPLRYIPQENIQIKGTQYVDDSNTFLNNKHEVPNFLTIMNKYEKASGSKMNKDKTLCLAIHNMIEEIINDISVTQGPEKILGVELGGNDPIIKNQFWDKIIKKLQEKLNIWRTRDLSLLGKTYVIKSVGVSKLQYAIQMRTIGQAHIKKINNMLWDFLWSGKTFRFSRDICKLPPEMGGLGLIDIEILIKVKRIQWIVRVLKDETNQNWSKLIENYLRCLDNKYGINLFTLKVTDANDEVKNCRIPTFYKECIMYFGNLCQIAKDADKELEIIWCNANYKFNNKPLNFSHWARSGIFLKSHLYDENGNLDETTIKRKLTHKANFMFEVQKLKKSFPRISQATHYTNGNTLKDENKQDILNYRFNVPKIGTKCLQDLTSQDIYNIFLHDNKPEMTKSKLYWENIIFTNRRFDWDKWFYINFQNKIIPKKVRDFNWKIFHGVVNTESRLERMNYSDGRCKCCNVAFENLEHLLINCLYRKRIWNTLHDLIKEIITNDPDFKLDKLEIMTGYFNNENETITSIINMCIGMTRYHLWISRNKIKHDEEQSSYAHCLATLKGYLLSHIKILLLSDKTEVNIKSQLQVIQNRLS